MRHNTIAKIKINLHDLFVRCATKYLQFYPNDVSPKIIYRHVIFSRNNGRYVLLGQIISEIDERLDCFLFAECNDELGNVS